MGRTRIATASLDPNEKDENRNSQVDPGILEYVTVYSKEPNTHLDGTALINVRTISGRRRQQLQALFATNFTSDRAQAIMRQLTGTGGTGGGRGGGGRGGGGGGGGGGTTTTMRSPLAVLSEQRHDRG